MGRFKLMVPAAAAVSLGALLLAWAPVRAEAAADVSDQDCGAILESYATDPKSVPKAVADACQQALLVAPAAGAPLAATATAADPCGGAGAAASVQCWGPWATPLQPLAGPPPPGPEPLVPFDEPRPEMLPLQSGEGGPAPPEFPVSPCDPGLPCGFATVVAGGSGADEPESTQFASVQLAPDGSSFAITGDGVAIESADDLTTLYSSRPDSFENLRAGRATLLGILTGEPSALIARALRDGDGLVMAGDFWSHDENGTENSGYFAWGRTLAQADIDALISGNAELTFTGPMSVDNATVANITLNYAATPSWTGNWTNPGWAFSAGGGVFGANFVSDAGQFSDNVQEGFVQGALVGDGGTRGVTHIVEVTLDGPGLIRDVGLLTEAGSTPTL